MIVDFLLETDLLSVFVGAAHSPVWQKLLPLELEDQTHFRDLYAFEKITRSYTGEKWACLAWLTR